MVRSRRFKFRLRFPPLGLGNIALYWHGGLWRDMLRQAHRLNVTATALEVAFLWLLGLLGGSFALLQGAQLSPELPEFSLYLGRWVQHLLLPGTPPQGAGINAVGVGAIAILAWLCLTAGTAKLCHLVSLIYRGASSRRSRWVVLILHWLLTLVLLMVANLALAWVGPASLTPEMAEALKLQTAEGSAVASTWQADLWHITRWPATGGIIALGLAILYRLSPQRWVRGLPLWPGIGLVLILGTLGLATGVWGIHRVATGEFASGLLLVLTIALLLLYGLILLVTLGAQFNVSLVNRGVRSTTSTRVPQLTTPPPSFDSFKINRGQGDRFPRE